MINKANAIVILVTAVICISLCAFQGRNDIKTILRDGQFHRLPKNAREVRTQIVKTDKKRFGYLLFAASAEDLGHWIELSKIMETSKEQIFNDNIIVWPNYRPEWFNLMLNKSKTDKVFFKNGNDSFVALIYLDRTNNRIILEYEVREE
jgi:hypothetical protein